MDDAEFVAAVLRNDVNRAVLDRTPLLDLPDWWLTAGAVFQTVWNVIYGRDPRAGISDYDLFSFGATDTSWQAEDDAIQRAAALFADLDETVEVRNDARVHLWYEDHFGVPAQPFRSSRDAAPRHVYETKAARWQAEWPRLHVDPWPDGAAADGRHEATSPAAPSSNRHASRATVNRVTGSPRDANS